MRSLEVATVDTWHRRLNSGDIEQLMTLIHHDVEVGGPRGVSSGSRVFREWFARAGVQLTPTRYFHKGNAVVAEENGVWRSPDDGHAIGSQVVSSLFTIEDGLITRIMRFDDLSTALKEAGMNELDEVQSDPLNTPAQYGYGSS
jgi:SnoaL-like protein